MNTITVETGHKTNSGARRRRVIIGVVLNQMRRKSGRTMFLVYDTLRMDPEGLRRFEALVDQWGVAIATGATNLPINLYHGAQFDQYEPYLMLLDGSAVHDVTGYVYKLSNHFSQGYTARRVSDGTGPGVVGNIRRRR